MKRYAKLYGLERGFTDARREQIAEHLNFCGPCGGAVEFEAELP